MTKIRVVAAVVDTKQLTLYKEDGDTVSIPQGDPRLRTILEEITPIISKGGVASVSVSELNVYRDFEEHTGGFARFFRVAKSKVAGFFGTSPHDADTVAAPVAPTGLIGSIPGLNTAIDDIIANAVPADSKIRSDETVVAVVGSGEAARIVPGMENLKDQFAHALKLGSTKGVENFLRRISAVIDQRQHSIHDLLRFMERGDLPIADDGSIVIYKVLNRQGDRFVDCHSKRVTQRVGSFVCMDPKMVDHNRRNECSNGLHVARRGYIGGFGGDVCVLAKVAPEDVIAVPNYDANKMRVCGYHIIFELDADSFSKLKNNRPMTDNPKAQALLGRAISGNHTRRLEEVRITEQRGGGVIITPLNERGQPQPRTPVRKVTAIDDVESVPSVDPKAVAKEVTKAKAKTSGRDQLAAVVATATGSRMDRARALYDNGDIRDLIAFKKRSKVSWASLGISEEEQAHILKMAAAPTMKVDPTPNPRKPAPKPGSMSKADVAKQEKLVSAVTPIVEAVAEHEEPAVAHPISKGLGVKARLFELEKVYSHKDGDNRHRGAAAAEMLLLRRKAKKSWSALGYPKLTDQLLRSDIERFAKANAKAKVATPPKPKHTCKPKKAAPVQAKASLKTYPDTQAGRARKLFDEKKFGPLYDLKQRSKKSWFVLGFSSQEIATIVNNNPDAR